MTRPARIPSDVNRPDRVIGPFTARQAVILAATAAALYLLWTVLRGHLPAAVFLAAAVPVAALATVIALGQRDGLSMDRLLLAALRHRLTPRAPAAEPPRSESSPPGEGVPDWISANTSVADEPCPARGRRLTEFPARAVTPVGAVALAEWDGLATVEALFQIARASSLKTASSRRPGAVSSPSS